MHFYYCDYCILFLIEVAIAIAIAAAIAIAVVVAHNVSAVTSFVTVPDVALVVIDVVFVKDRPN